ncbi:MAG: ABC transporter permease [Proteobacteria bacterium]|nr:MAG: ABC transporter permease [Pseudomonadota bacterium]
MREGLAQLPALAAAHLELSLAALVIAAAIAVPLGIAVARRPRLGGPVLAAAGVIQTIPGLALLALMVPLFALLGAFGARHFGIELRAIGAGPALVALVLYGVLPILQNTAAGLAGVDPAAREAARAVGMTPRQSLLGVELPLALPVVIAGLRTAAVWIVGTATLSTPVGAPSLGNLIFSGLQTRRFEYVWLGCVASAALALGIDAAIRLLEAGVRRRRRAWVALACGAFAAAALGLLAARGVGAVGRETTPIRIGAKAFTEQYVLAEILAGRLAATGAATEVLPSLGSTVLFDALRSGEVDAYVDYSGTLWATVLQRRGAPGDRAAVLDDVARTLAARHEIEVAAALGFENTYALAMRRDHAARRGIETLAQLAAAAPALELGADYEFLARAEWRALVAAYGLRFRASRSMDPSLLYQAVAAGEVDVISAFSTDGRIEALDLAVLRDEQGVIPPYDAVVLVGPRLAQGAPAALAALRRLAGAIDAEAMRRMNAAVDQQGRAPRDVAREWLAAHPD